MSKKIIIILGTLPVIAIIGFIFIVVIAVCGYEVGESIIMEQASQMRNSATVINNQLYSDIYKNLLNKYLITKGYVSLERLVYYLQRTHNILDTSTLSYAEWENAYLFNINEKEKQMVPIKTICKSLNESEGLPDFTIETDTNDDGILIDVLDLCHIGEDDIANRDDYDEEYYPLIYTFPLKTNFTITSVVFEYRDVDLGLSEEEQAKTNFHSGWDFAVPIGTEFYSICDGTIKTIVNTQSNDLVYKESGNATGNYIEVTCRDGNTVSYHHIKYMSLPYGLKVNSIVKQGDLLGKTSTTGKSTGPHLHLGLKDKDGKLLDAVSYIDFTKYEGN